MSRPTIQEIAALTARLRELSNAGREADPAEVEKFLDDKHEILDRITDRPSAAGGRDEAFASYAAEDAVRDVARAQAEAGGYVLVGPSARTWRADAAGRPVEPATEAEHRAVRELLGREQLDTTEPAWTSTADGRTDIVSAVIPTADAYGAAWSDDPFADDAARHSDDVGASPSPWEDYRTYTPAEAAAELIARGIPPDQAPAIVDRYVDSLTYERGWSPQDQWEIDDDDLAIMTDPSASDIADAPPPGSSADLGLTPIDGPPIPSGPTLSAADAARALTADGWPPDEARTQVARYLDDVSAQLGTSAHAWGLDEADLDAIRATDAGRTADAVQHAHQTVSSAEPSTDTSAACLVDEQPPEADVDVFE